MGGSMEYLDKDLLDYDNEDENHCWQQRNHHQEHKNATKTMWFGEFHSKTLQESQLLWNIEEEKS